MPVSPPPPRQPEAVPPGFVGHRNPIDRAVHLGCFVPPARPYLEPHRLIRREFLQRLPLIPGTMPATSEVDWLISMTTMSVLS
jgi:hypothetical protein